MKVVAPIDNTPASHSGIQSGDLIIRLNDTTVKGLSLGKAANIMRGQPGSKLLLTIIRDGEDKPLQIELVRSIIKVESVRYKTLEYSYGYIRISTFKSLTGASLKRAINQLKEENNGTLKGLILDLRNNPGGLLDAAVAVSDAFISTGNIVYTEGRIKDAAQNFIATPTDILNGAPLVVLVNGGSASASELVAGALQDNNRAVILGSKTFGKGSVQTLIPLTNNTAIKITTALYFTPSGHSIQEKGIVPDIEIDDVKLSPLKNIDLIPLREQDLSGHLLDKHSKHKDTDNKIRSSDSKEWKNTNHITANDYYLSQALNLLKGINILYPTKNDMS